ncbi:MAG TPA: cupin domain-containing protein [Steroidobacteraceae bacterium]|nr:cupin domain-containing protein [Steroidobacteraceae bacterium]HQR48472.1 cupin domain-containing protein [Steroidobacteraceae bacterium]
MITFPRVHTDELGETHIGVRELPRHDAALGPPPNPVGRMTDPIMVSTLVTYSAPAGAGATWHTAPQPYICIVLSGEGEVVASDGTTRRLVPGDVMFFDDVTGKGHITRAITDLHVALINRSGA